MAFQLSVTDLLYISHDLGEVILPLCPHKGNQLKGGTRGNDKPKKDRFRLDIREDIFTMKVVKHWKRLPSKVMGILSLETSQTGWDCEQPD